MLLKHKVITLFVVSVICGITSTVSAAPVANARTFGTNQPFTIDNLPPGLLKKQLKELPANAHSNALKWLHSIQFHNSDVPFMQVDKNGAIFFVDPVFTDFTNSSNESTGEPGTATVTATEAFTLHSKPGAEKVIYLDFDGHTLSGTAWNSSYSTLAAQPYDLDSNPGAFSATELANIAEIWRRIAEDYTPFDVDVTTEPPAQFGSNTGRLLITRNVDANGNPMPADTAGGVAYVNVWGRGDFSYYSPALVYYNNLGGGRPDYVAEAASHEMGHNMGLSHDATSTTSYYGGHGSGNISWGPIMGTGYNRNVSQWSKGEYNDANQFQDDIALIAAKVNYRADDHSDQSGQATPLEVAADGSVNATTMQNDPMLTNPANRGLISSRDDVDVFSFSTTGGTVQLQASPVLETNYTGGSNLDIALALYDQQGNLLTSDNPADDTNAQLTYTTVAGSYFLSVSGSGSANYTDYGSLGRYSLSGNLPVNNDTNPPEPAVMSWASVPQAIDYQSIGMTATTAIDDTSAVEYYFACTAGGTGCQDSGWMSSATYTTSGLAAATSYSFRVKARDSFGNETEWSAEASATTDTAPVINHPPVANADAVEVLLRGSADILPLENDSDPDGDGLTLTAVSTAGKGTLSVSGNQITYTAGSKRGGDTFTYTITDGNGNYATGTVSVAIVRNLSGGRDSGSGGGGKGRNK